MIASSKTFKWKEDRINDRNYESCIKHMWSISDESQEAKMARSFYDRSVSKKRVLIIREMTKICLVFIKTLSKTLKAKENQINDRNYESCIKLLQRSTSELQGNYNGQMLLWSKRVKGGVIIIREVRNCYNFIQTLVRIAYRNSSNANSALINTCKTTETTAWERKEYQYVT